MRNRHSGNYQHAGMLNPTFCEEQIINRLNEMEAEVLIVVNELYTIIQNVIPKTSIKHVITCPATNSLGKLVRMAKRVSPIPGSTSWKDFIRHGEGCTYQPAPYEEQTLTALSDQFRRGLFLFLEK